MHRPGQRITTLEQENELLRQEITDLEDELGAAGPSPRADAEINRGT